MKNAMKGKLMAMGIIFLVLALSGCLYSAGGTDKDTIILFEYHSVNLFAGRRTTTFIDNEGAITQTYELITFDAESKGIKVLSTQIVKGNISRKQLEALAQQAIDSGFFELSENKLNKEFNVSDASDESLHVQVGGLDNTVASYALSVYAPKKVGALIDAIWQTGFELQKPYINYVRIPETTQGAE